MCTVPGCATAGPMCTRRMLADPRVVYVRCYSNLLCCSVRGTICLQSRTVLLPDLCVLEVYWTSQGLCAFDVNRSCRAALYVGYIFNPGLCSCRVYMHATCAGLSWGCIRLTSIELAVLPCTWAVFVQSSILLLPGLYAFDVFWPSLGLSRIDVSETCCVARYVSQYVCTSGLYSCRGYVHSTCAGRV